MSIETTGGDVWEIIKKLCLAATVYYIWQERNSRIFTSQKRSADEMFKTICEEIKAKMVSIRVKQTKKILNAETIWNIKFDRNAWLLTMWQGILRGCLDEHAVCEYWNWISKEYMLIWIVACIWMLGAEVCRNVLW